MRRARRAETVASIGSCLSVVAGLACGILWTAAQVGATREGIRERQDLPFARNASTSWLERTVSESSATPRPVVKPVAFDGGMSSLLHRLAVFCARPKRIVVTDWMALIAAPLALAVVRSGASEVRDREPERVPA